MKLEWKRIFIIGLAFFSVSIAWSVYNSYVPVFLDKLISSSALVGFVMTFDNIAGLIFQPFFGKKSDSTRTRLGRRIPYMIVGVPVAAVFLVLIPLHTIGKTPTAQLLLLMMAVVGMNFFMSIYRAPAVALMPDATPSPLRSRANGVINFMGGFGSVAAFLAGGYMYKQGASLPFVFAAVMMILALIALLLFYREPAIPFSSDESGKNEKEKDAALFFRRHGKSPLWRQNPSLIFMLLSIFFWFCGYNGVETFFTLFCQQKFDMNPGTASQYLTFMAMTFLVFAIPSGLIGSRWGRKRTMFAGVVLMAGMFLLIILLNSKAALPFMLVGAGIGWALININSYPTIVQMAPKGETGKYTGFYYAFSFSASIVSPILFGFIADLMDSYRSLFYYGMVMFLLAILTLSRVKLRKEEIEPHGHVLETLGND